MGLHTQLPLGVGEAVVYRKIEVKSLPRAIHGLEVEMLEVHIGEAGGVGRRLDLGVNELEFLAADLLERSIGLGAYAYPIDALWNNDRPIGLYGDLESSLMQEVDEGSV